MASYISFARFYDGLMVDADYEKRCDYLMELFRRHNHETGITLDLACGTGSLTRLLTFTELIQAPKCSAKQCRGHMKKILTFFI